MVRGMYGKKHLEESKIKMKNSREEGIKNGIIKIWNKGKHPKYMFGNNNPAKRLEVRKKISLSKLGITRDDSTKKKMSMIMKERWKIKEKREKMSKILRKISKNTQFKDGHLTSEKTRRALIESRMKQIFPLKDSSIEVKIQKFLKKLGYEFFTHQYIKEIEHGYQCDILIPSMNLVIECDGDYWHKYPIGRDIDKIRTSELIEKGFKVLRLWEHEIKIMNINKFKELLT